MTDYILHCEKSILHPGELFFFYQTKAGALKEKEAQTHVPWYKTKKKGKK